MKNVLGEDSNLIYRHSALNSGHAGTEALSNLIAHFDGTPGSVESTSERFGDALLKDGSEILRSKVDGPIEISKLNEALEFAERKYADGDFYRLIDRLSENLPRFRNSDLNEIQSALNSSRRRRDSVRGVGGDNSLHDWLVHLEGMAESHESQFLNFGEANQFRDRVFSENSEILRNAEGKVDPGKIKTIFAFSKKWLQSEQLESFNEKLGEFIDSTQDITFEQSENLAAFHMSSHENWRDVEAADLSEHLPKQTNGRPKEIWTTKNFLYEFCDRWTHVLSDEYGAAFKSLREYQQSKRNGESAGNTDALNSVRDEVHKLLEKKSEHGADLLAKINRFLQSVEMEREVVIEAHNESFKSLIQGFEEKSRSGRHLSSAEAQEFRTKVLADNGALLSKLDSKEVDQAKLKEVAEFAKQRLSPDDARPLINELGQRFQDEIKSGDPELRTIFESVEREEPALDFQLADKEITSYAEVQDSFKHLKLLRASKDEEVAAARKASHIENDDSYKAFPDLYVENQDGHRKVPFATLNENGEINLKSMVWVATEGNALSRWNKEVSSSMKALGRHIKFAKDVAKESFKHIYQGDTEAQAVHTLNAAFLLMTLLESDEKGIPGRELLFENSDDLLKKYYDDSNISELDRASLKKGLERQKTQMGFNFAQQVIGLVHDATELTKVLMAARKTLPGAASAIGKAAGALGAVGMGFDIVNLGFSISSLIEADKNNDQKARGDAIAQISISGVSLTTTTVSLVAGGIAAVTGSTAAATAAAFVGGLGVPIAGVGIGAAALVSAYNDRAVNIQRGLDMLNTVGQSVEKIGLKIEDGMIKPKNETAVIESIDLVKNRMKYGTVSIAESLVRVPWLGVSKTRYLNIYEAYDLTEEINTGISVEKADCILLPYAVGGRFTYHYTDSPGWFTEQPTADKLTQYFDDENGVGNFFWKAQELFYQAVISGLSFEPGWTPVKVILDAGREQRFLIYMATDVPESSRPKLSYELFGGGGDYELLTSTHSLKTYISPSVSAIDTETWRIDFTNYVYEGVTKDFIGNLKPDVLKHVVDGEYPIISVDHNFNNIEFNRQPIWFETQGLPPNKFPKVEVRIALKTIPGAFLILNVDWREKKLVPRNVVTKDLDCFLGEGGNKIVEFVELSGLELPDGKLDVFCYDKKITYLGVFDVKTKDYFFHYEGIDGTTNIIVDDKGPINIKFPYGFAFQKDGHVFISTDSQAGVGKNLATFEIVNRKPVLYEYFKLFQAGSVIYNSFDIDTLNVFVQSGKSVPAAVPDEIKYFVNANKIVIRNYEVKFDDKLSSKVNNEFELVEGNLDLLDLSIKEVVVDAIDDKFQLNMAQDLSAFNFKDDGDDKILSARNFQFRLRGALRESVAGREKVMVSFPGYTQIASLLSKDLKLQDFTNENDEAHFKLLENKYGTHLSRISKEMKGHFFLDVKEKILSKFADLYGDRNTLSLDGLIKAYDKTHYGDLAPIENGDFGARRFFVDNKHTVYIAEDNKPLSKFLPPILQPFRKVGKFVIINNEPNKEVFSLTGTSLLDYSLEYHYKIVGSKVELVKQFMDGNSHAIPSGKFAAIETVSPVITVRPLADLVQDPSDPLKLHIGDELNWSEAGKDPSLLRVAVGSVSSASFDSHDDSQINIDSVASETQFSQQIYWMEPNQCYAMEDPYLIGDSMRFVQALSSVDDDAAGVGLEGHTAADRQSKPDISLVKP